MIKISTYSCVPCKFDINIINHITGNSDAKDIIGMNLVTPQTGPAGKKVHKVLIEQGIYYPGESEIKEFYVSILLNRAIGRNIIMYSTEGGMDIEGVAENTP